LADLSFGVPSTGNPSRVQVNIRQPGRCQLRRQRTT